MTTNITSGNTAQFVAEFLDVNGDLTVPTASTLTITYPVGLTTVSTAISMTQTNSFYTATWSSSVSSLGAATWSITAVGSTTPAATGDLRIITP